MRRLLLSTTAISGLIFLCLALLAYRLGIDNDPGWGRGRILLAVFGIVLLAGAGLSWQWQRVRLPLSRLSAVYERSSGKAAEWMGQQALVRGAQRIRRRFLRLPGVDWLAESVERRAALAGGLALAITGLILAWFLTAGTLDRWFPYQHAYFDRLADAFLSGQLNLLEQPDPRLLALADPYPYQNRQGVNYLWDVSFFDGKFFLYWGPTPGLLLAMAKLIARTHIEDQVLAAAFLGGLAGLLGWLAGAMWREFARKSNPSGFFLLLLAGGLNLYMLWPTGRPGVYETAILAGQFFLLGGLLALFYALRGPGLRPGLTLVGGACLALAVGSRVTLAVVVGWLVLAVVWRTLALGRGGAGRIKSTLAGMLLPLILGGAGLLWYNAARFGNPFETGIRYQLGIPQFPHTLAQFFSAVNFFPNLFGYLARAPLFEAEFPFVIVPFVKEIDWPWFIRLPEHFIYHEPQAGVLFGFPLIFFGLIPGVKLLRIAGECLRRAAWTKSLRMQALSFENWWGLTLLGSLLLQLLLLLLYFFSAIRYQVELVPVGFLPACLGIWQAERTFDMHPRWRRIFWLAVTVLAIFTLTVGLLGGLSAGDQRFEANNPELYNTLREASDRMIHR